MILSAIAAKLKQRAKADFRGRHFEAALIVQAVSWYLRYPLSYRDIEELFLERGLEVDHSTLNRWVLAYAPLIEKRLRRFRRPHCGSVRIDETYVKVRGEWRYLYRAIDKHGAAVDFLLTANRDLDAAKRFFRKMLQDQPLLAPDRIGTDGAGPYPSAIVTTRQAGLLPRAPIHYVTKHHERQRRVRKRRRSSAPFRCARTGADPGRDSRGRPSETDDQSGPGIVPMGRVAYRFLSGCGSGEGGLGSCEPLTKFSAARADQQACGRPQGPAPGAQLRRE